MATSLDEFSDNLSTEELRRMVMDFRLSQQGSLLTNRLKEEWRQLEEYCKHRRKQNFDNRKIISTGSTQGVSREGSRQEQMKIPLIVEIETEKRFGPDWHKDQKAHDWQWKTYPQFRLVEKR